MPTAHTCAIWALAAASATTQSAAVLTGNPVLTVQDMCGDAWILARVAEGETGFLFPETEAERWVMWTVRNRVESDRFPGEYWEVVEQGYHGHRIVAAPDKGLLLLAQRVIDAPVSDDPAGSCYFVYSADDVLALGLSTEGVIRELHAGRWGLYFFRDEPEREESDVN